MPQLTAQKRAELRARFQSAKGVDLDAVIDAVTEAVSGEPDTLHWHALNYRTAATQHAQAMFERLEDWVRRNTAPPPSPVVRITAQVLLDGRVIHTTPQHRVIDGANLQIFLTNKP